jgi:hypothetical protein
MKVTELFEAKPSSVQIKNKSGSYKRFKSMSSPGAAEWAASHDEPVKKRQKMSDEERKDKRAKAQEAKRQLEYQIDTELSMIAAQALDGSDPSFKLERIQRKYEIDMDAIDRIIRKFNKGTKGFYDYLADMWDDTAGDHVHDAKQGHVDDNSPFYRVDKDGNIKPESNPWR